VICQLNAPPALPPEKKLRGRIKRRRHNTVDIDHRTQDEKEWTGFMCLEIGYEGGIL
jgi:hypothetical protein